MDYFASKTEVTDTKISYWRPI